MNIQKYRSVDALSNHNVVSLQMGCGLTVAPLTQAHRLFISYLRKCPCFANAASGFQWVVTFGSEIDIAAHDYRTARRSRMCF